MKEIFTGKENRLSSKRVIGTIIIGIAMSLMIDSHFSSRELNIAAFSTMMTTGGVMIVGGVLENKIGGSGQSYRTGQRRRKNRKELE